MRPGSPEASWLPDAEAMTKATGHQGERPSPGSGDFADQSLADRVNHLDQMRIAHRPSPKNATGRRSPGELADLEDVQAEPSISGSTRITIIR
jgi:hypothetical protein